MSSNRRQIGGQSNRQGNSYESFFATFSLLKHAPKVIDEGVSVRLKMQAACPVDDIILRVSESVSYHQLKSGQSVSWTADDKKIQNEFSAQQQNCLEAGERFSLVLVVASESQAERLRATFPDILDERTTFVMLFPLVETPSKLARLADLRETLDDIRASRFPSLNADQDIAKVFHIEFIDHTPGADGFYDLSTIIQKIRENKWVRIRQVVQVPLEQWPAVEDILRQIEGLQWWVDRGYFEWKYKQTDYGEILPLDETRFAEFVERIIQNPPRSFEDFEVLV